MTWPISFLVLTGSLVWAVNGSLLDDAVMS